MIKVTSNIDEFLKYYKGRIENFKNMLENIAEKLAQRMSQDMKALIYSETSTWSPDAENNDETGKMAYHRGKEISVEINHIGNGVRVVLGENLDKHEMSNGSLVNPLYFIEFGFGVRGESKPAHNHEKVNWEYNKRNRQEAWGYQGWDGKIHISDGIVGTNFMYRTMDDYRTNWKKYLKELLEEQANG